MSLEDMTLTEVHCYECGKPISSIPPWLAGASVKFQCEECRQKHPRVPGMAELEPRRAASDVDELGDLAEVVEDTDEEADEDVADEADEIGE
jgi:hypothetical protein